MSIKSYITVSCKQFEKKNLKLLVKVRHCRGRAPLLDDLINKEKPEKKTRKRS